MLQSFLFKIKDRRRKQGQRYQQGHILLFSIFAILSGANSYRKIRAFVKTHYQTLNEAFDLNWKRIPWDIENGNHYVRDVTLGEDKSRIRDNPHIFAQLRSFALNILRAHNVKNVNLELFDNCMDLNRVLSYVGVA